MKDDDTKNPTESLSDIQSEGGLLSPRALLGDRELERRASDKVLLRLEKGILPGALASKLGLNPFEPRSSGPRSQLPPLVLGPFSLEAIQAWIAEGALPPTDYIQKPYDRWRMLVTVFPELSHQMTQITDSGSEKPEDQTLSLSSQAGFDTEKNSLEMDSTRVEDSSSREVSNSGLKVEIDNPEEHEGPSLSLEESPEESESSKKVSKQDSKLDSTKQSNPAAAAGPQVLVGGAAATVKIRLSDPRFERVRNVYFEYDPIRFSFLIFILVVVSGISYWLTLQVKKQSEPLSQVAELKGQDSESPEIVSNLESVPSSWPPNLRPLEVSSLRLSDDPLVERIRPILNSYESGVTRLSPSEEQILQSFSQAGTSSWEARRLAANRLAIFYVSTNRLSESQKTLEPIFAAVPGDQLTLLNLSLISFIEGDWKRARELSESALRLSGPEFRWIAQSLWGLIIGAGPTKNQTGANNAFMKALESSPNNGLVFGLWIRALTQGPQSPELSKLKNLVKRTLWSDPDRLVDSPIPAPFGGHILQAESLLGFEKVIDYFPNVQDLSLAHRNYLRWLDPRNRLNPLSNKIEGLQSQLVAEGSELSKILFGYTLAKENKFEESSQILTETLNKIPTNSDEFGSIRSSWPWALAGDVLFELGQWDRSRVFYEKALLINSNDVSAVWGMALYHRQKENFVAAEQKLQETLALDPNFVPARLRRTRLDWHRRFNRE